MDRDDFIISVYCLVGEHYPVIRVLYGVRHGGFAPALIDKEVITMKICGEYFKCGTDKDLLCRQQERPGWKKRMAAKRHKTLVVCRTCHESNPLQTVRWEGFAA